MAVLETLLEITIYSTVIFAAIMLVKACFKNKISPFLQYAIWGIFLLRLMLPVTIESSVRLITLPAETTVSTEETTQGAQKDAFDFMAPSSEADAKAQNVLDSEKSNTLTESAKQGGDTVTAATQAIRLTLSQILLMIWLCGLAVCFCYFTILAFLLKRNLFNKPVAPSLHLLTLLEQVKAELGIRANLKLRCQDGYGTPAMLFPQTIFLPMRTLAPMDDEQVRNCIRHECMHHKRGDHILNILLLLLNAIYWFNPFVWVAFYQTRRDMESACDSAVVRHMNPLARRDYATLILGMFSQEKHRQIALGMVQGNTKKIAEQRIKGIFMKNNSGKTIRIAAAMLALVLFVCCFTTACQPTPDAPVVVGKGDGLSDLIQSTPGASGSVSPSGTSAQNNDALYAKLDVPKHWTFETTALGDQLNITADVDIELPNVSQLPAATASLSAFTQEDLEKIAKVIGIEGAEWTEINNEQTKEEIAEYLVGRRADLARLKAEEPNNAAAIENAEASIEYHEKLYVDAPDEIELKSIAFQIGEVSYGEDFDGNAVTRIGFEGTTQLNDQPFYFFASVDDDIYGNRMWANYGSRPAGFGGVRIDEPYGVSLTKEQAASQASEIAAQLTDELTLCCVAPAATFKQETTPRNWGWACVFMREINGCPTAYELTEIGSDMETTVSEPIPYEKMVIVMDDAGMVSFEWETPMTVKSIDNTDVSLAPFDKIAQRAAAQIGQFWAYNAIEAKSNEGKDMSDPGCTAIITKVELGLMRVAKADSEDYYYIPVWNFFTDLEHTDDYWERTGREPYSSDEHDDVDEDGNLNCGLLDGFPQDGTAVTINALDGSVIDRNLGY